MRTRTQRNAGVSSRRRAGTSRAPTRANAAPVDLETKTLPSQARSRSTFGAILRVAGEILNDDGLDGLSINAVCRQAGLTPPAVYRYFPNKYALLKALAERLMEAQDDAVLAVARRRTPAHSEPALAEEMREILRDVAAVTAAFPGNVFILRALRVTPILRDVRRASTAKVAAQRVERRREAGPPDQDFAVAAQQADEEQRPGRAGRDQHLVIGEAQPGGQQPAQRRVAGGGAIAEVHLGQASQAAGAEQVGNRQIAGHALTKVVPRFPVD